MSGKNILFLNPFREYISWFCTEAGRQKCREYGFQLDCPAADGDLGRNYDWQSIIGNYDALITTWGSPVCSADFLKAAPRVQILGHCAGSVVAVTDPTTYQTPVHVTTANSVMAEAVAEWSLMATLIAQRNPGVYAAFGHGTRMNWQKSRCGIADIHSMTIGIWGMGDVSHHLLKLLQPLRPGRILVCSGHASEEELQLYHAEKCTFEQLFAESDVIHCLSGVNRSTYRKVGAREFDSMKSDAVFINGGRSRLCDQNALLAALHSGKIRAVLDVFDEEPLPDDSPFYGLDNVLLTPHNAGYSGYHRYLPFLLDEFHRFFNGEPLLAEITKKRFMSMTDEHLR